MRLEPRALRRSALRVALFVLGFAGFGALGDGRCEPGGTGGPAARLVVDAASARGLVLSGLLVGSAFAVADWIEDGLYPVDES